MSANTLAKQTLTTKKGQHEKAAQVVHLLALRYPQPQTHLHASNAWELLVATVLAAQCTDARVNLVTPALFARWPTPEALAKAPLAQVEACIHSTGFFRNKAKNIVAAAERVVTVYAGQVPKTMAELVTLPGVARKTANVVLWTAYGKNEGIAVDTHVHRIARRLGLATSERVQVVEKELMALFPRNEWGDLNHRMVWFGRHVCDARKPLCSACEMTLFCPKNGVVLQQQEKS